MPKRVSQKEVIEKCINVHGDRYDYSESEYLGAHKKIKILCKFHKEYFWQTPANHIWLNQDCPKCMLLIHSSQLLFNNKIIDNFIEENKLKIKRIDNYIKSNIKIEWSCLECDNNWKASPNSIRQGSGCPKCNDTKLSNKYIDQFLLEHNTNIIRLEEHINAYTKIGWKCGKCDYIWQAKPGEIMRYRNGVFSGSGCPAKCRRGKNERIVCEYFLHNNIKYINQFNVNLGLSKTNNRVDVYLPELNTIVEYNGIQHYQPTYFGYYSEDKANENFVKQQIRDNALREYCKTNSINLIEIDGRKYKGNMLMSFIKEVINEIRNINVSR